MDFKRKAKLPWLSHFLYSLRHRGLFSTCSMGIREWQKERELGIRTFGTQEPSRPCGGHLYQPSSSVIFKKAMGKLPVNFPECVFLDLGSGKGRALVLAAEAGFRKVIGVEYASELNDVARNNIEQVRNRFSRTVFELMEGDALTYEIPIEVDVIYLFNPFDRHAIARLSERVEPVFRQEKQVHLVYVHPVHSALLEKTFGQPADIVKNRKGTIEAAIFRNR